MGLPSGLDAGDLPWGISNVSLTEKLSGVGSHLAQNVVLSGRFQWSWCAGGASNAAVCTNFSRQ